MYATLPTQQGYYVLAVIFPLMLHPAPPNLQTSYPWIKSHCAHVWVCMEMWPNNKRSIFFSLGLDLWDLEFFISPEGEWFDFMVPSNSLGDRFCDILARDWSLYSDIGQYIWPITIPSRSDLHAEFSFHLTLINWVEQKVWCVNVNMNGCTNNHFFFR